MGRQCIVHRMLVRTKEHLPQQFVVFGKGDTYNKKTQNYYTYSFITYIHRQNFKLIQQYLFMSCFRKLLKAIQCVNLATDKTQLRYVLSAIDQETKVGALQAAWALLGLPFVQKSRKVDSLNSLHSDQLIRKIGAPQNTILDSVSDDDDEEEPDINTNDPDVHEHTINLTDSVIEVRLGQPGRRRAYELLCQQQHTKYQKCHITIYAMMTHYNITIPQKAPTKVYDIPFFQMNPTNGRISTGSPKNPSFYIAPYSYSPQVILKVVNLTPYIPVNTNDLRSAYSILFCHIPWPKTRIGSNGQDMSGQSQIDLCGDGITLNAVTRLEEYYQQELIMSYIHIDMSHSKRTDELNRSNGRPACGQGNEDTADELYIDNVGGGRIFQNDFVGPDMQLQQPIPLMHSDNTIDRLRCDLSKSELLYFSTYIERERQEWHTANSNKYQIQPNSEDPIYTEESKSDDNPSGMIHATEADMTKAYSNLYDRVLTLKPGQKTTYDSITSWLKGDTHPQEQMTGFF